MSASLTKKCSIVLVLIPAQFKLPSMDSSLSESSFAFDLNKSSDSPEKQFEGGEILVDGNRSSSLDKEEPNLLKDKLNQMRSRNKKLFEVLFKTLENYCTLQSHLFQLVQESSGDELSRKRKFEVENCISPLGNDTSYDSISDEGLPKRPREIRTNISTVYVRVDPSDTSLVVKDGYHWRKYGQKVTKDNPSPRAYYKCSFAPSCLVKKKVQRSVGDPSTLVATYEGEHNHPNPLRTEMLMSSAQGAAAVLSPSSKCFECYSSPKERFDSTGNGLVSDSYHRSIPTMGSNAIQQLMVEQMASSLIRKPSFTAAIAAAISERIANHDPEEN